MNTNSFYKQKKHQGFFSIVAIILIVMVGLISVFAIKMLSRHTQISVLQLQAARARLSAQTGIEIASTRLLTHHLRSRLTCGGSGQGSLTKRLFTRPLTLNRGFEYRIRQATPSVFPHMATARLTQTVSSFATTIPVSNTYGFSKTGIAYIDGEAFSYSGMTPHTFTQVHRGVFGTPATPHFSQSRSHAVTLVSQYQCDIVSQGYAPQLEKFMARYQIDAAIQLPYVVAVGQQFSASWNQPKELAWEKIHLKKQWQLNAISLLNPSFGWAVGDTFKQTEWGIARLTKVVGNHGRTTWLYYPTVMGGDKSITHEITDLRAVSVLNASSAFAVGDAAQLNKQVAPGLSHSNNQHRQRGNTPKREESGKKAFTILHFNGYTWCLLSTKKNQCSNITLPSVPASLKQANLYGIAMLDTRHQGTADLGFAVGSNGLILKFNGKTWQVIQKKGQTLRAVAVLPKQGWIVGDHCQMLMTNAKGRWRSVSLSRLCKKSNLTALTMVDDNHDGYADFGYVVGSRGIALYFNGIKWVRLKNTRLKQARGVIALGQEDVFAVGLSGRVVHYDGRGWRIQATFKHALMGIAKIAPPLKRWSLSHVYAGSFPPTR